MKGKGCTRLGLGYKVDASEFLKTDLKVEQTLSPIFLATQEKSQLTI